jgi:uncharacterized protein YrrD
MKRSIKSLIGYTMGATDGEIGNVKDFYFDDQSWTIRYLIVETGSWLNDRKVLISPQALLTPDWKNKVFPINLTKEKIKNSPDTDTEQTVSRQHEIEMYEYYPWTNYWGGGIWGDGMGTSGMMTEVHEPLAEAFTKENNTNSKNDDGDPHLRSTRRVTSYSVLANDGKIGAVEDFIIDDYFWKLHFLVVDTGHWFPGKKVLISPKMIKTIEWESSEVIVDVKEADIKDSPEYEPGEPIAESYEANLQNYYGKLMDKVY